jgi:hypothetical protein
VSKRSRYLPALALLVLSGYGGNLVRVTGQVVENGQPRRLEPGESVQVEFVTVGNSPRTLSLGIFPNRDGALSADQNDGTGAGIPPGQYKVRLNLEGASVKTKVAGKLFQESYALGVVPGKLVHLTIDLLAGTITE